MWALDHKSAQQLSTQMGWGYLYGARLDREGMSELMMIMEGALSVERWAVRVRVVYVYISLSLCV